MNLPKTPMNEAIIYIDGAARGNPGPAAYAVVLHPPGQPAIEQAGTIGRATNNVAEYTALIQALELALAHQLRRVQILSDSELLVKQMTGAYRVKHPDLIHLHQQARALADRLEHFDIRHVRREQNKRADELCNQALDAEKPKRIAPTVAKPKATVTDAAVREDAILCLQSAARAWAAGGQHTPTPEAVWEQIWSILQDGNVLRKVKS